MVIGPILGAGASLASALLGNRAQQDANNIGYLNLYETRRRNRATENMAKSSRRDAYGNLMKYTPGVGWEIDTTPMTSAILGAQQKEELEGLRTDAPMARAARVRQDKRASSADDEFEKRFNEFKYRPRKSEEAEVGDATNLLLSTRRKGLDEASALLARQLMRTGGSSELSRVYKGANDTYVQSLEDAILKGRSMGKEAYRQNEQSDLSNRGGELKLLASLAGDTANPNLPNVSGYDSDLSGRSDDALKTLLSAMQQGTGNINNASSALMRQVAGSGLDLSGFANALGGLDFGGGGDTDDIASKPRGGYRDPWLFPNGKSMRVVG